MRKGSKHSTEAKQKMSHANLGKKKPEEFKKQMSIVMKRTWAEGKLISHSREEASHWKGDDISYSGIHKWIKKQWGIAERCDNKSCKGLGARFEWANISKKYIKENYTRNREDWMQLCSFCHRQYDHGLLEVTLGF